MYASNHSDDNTLYVEDEQVGLGGTVTRYKPDNGRDLKSFENIIVTINNASGGKAHALYGGTLQDGNGFGDFSNTSFNVNISGDATNADALHIEGWENHVVIKNFTANVSTKNSDAINMGHEGSGNKTGDPTLEILGNLTAIVNDGNGIRANGSIVTANPISIMVHGDTDITLNRGIVRDSKSFSLYSFEANYNTAAVYAGNSQYNYMSVGSETLSQGQIYLKGKTKVTLNDNGSYGVLAGKNGYVSINDITINAEGIDSIGVAASNINLIYNDCHFTILGGLIDREHINGDTSSNRFGSVVQLDGDSNIIYMQNGAKALYVSSEYGKIYSGENGIGYLQANGIIESTNKGNINLTVRDYVNLTGTVVASSSGDTSMNIDGSLSIVAPETTPGYDYTAAIVAGEAKYKTTMVSDYSSVNLTYGENGNIRGDILSGYGGDVDIAYLSKSRAVSGAMTFNGNALAANGGTIDLIFGDNSVWSGRSDDYQDADNPDWNHSVVFEPSFSDGISVSGKVNVSLGNNSTWNVTGQSWITNLSANDSTIDLTNADTNHAIHIGHLEGANNTFVMNLSMDGSGNMLYVKDGSSSTQNIAINNRDEVLGSMKVGDRVRFATIANSKGGFENAGIGDAGVATFGRSARIADAGINNVDFDIVYEDYDLEDSAENDKYNNAKGFEGTSITEAKPGSNYVNSIYGSGENAQNAYLVRLAIPDEGGSEEVLSDAGRTIINMSRSNYSNAVYMDTLNKRQGEARYGIGQDNGVWVRMRHDNIGKEDSFRSNNTMFEIGYDIKNNVEGGQWRTGIALDYMNGQNDYHNVNGDGDIQRYGAWLYSTWFSDDGQYADFVLKYGHLKNDFDIYASTTGEKISGDYSNEVVSLSAEYGWKFANEQGWYVEPQAQLQYSYVSSADYTTSQNSKVELDSINSLIGRVGFRAGYDFATENPITAYIRGDVLHEFFGDQDISAFDNTGRLDTTYENDDTWYNVGVGLSVMSSQNTYFFIEGEQSFGADNEDTYTVSGGFRHNF